MCCFCKNVVRCLLYRDIRGLETPRSGLDSWESTVFSKWVSTISGLGDFLSLWSCSVGFDSRIESRGFFIGNMGVWDCF